MSLGMTRSFASHCCMPARQTAQVPKKQIRMYNLFGKHLSRFFMGFLAKRLGCKEKLAQDHTVPKQINKGASY